ncbi:MAG: pyridoxine 5'-phosphate synthase [Proteobacteria bacterium]|nr:MAG: pyridoxine 5'-phosphate synthase [Pseudomonadota bacterium]
MRLGVNIDHVATVRNARGESYPSPVQAAVMAELGGADNITCHLREDRRHIRDADVRLLKDTIQVPLNFEIAATEEMVAYACDIVPHAVTLVPEKRQELTTEGGLDLTEGVKKLENDIKRLRDKGILVSLFVEADPKAIAVAAKIGAQAIEIHTGHWCTALGKLRTTPEAWRLIKDLQDAAQFGHDQGLQVHVGHGLNYVNAAWMQLLPFCEEANIGHAIISRALFVGLPQAVKEMKALINNVEHRPIRGNG